MRESAGPRDPRGQTFYPSFVSFWWFLGLAATVVAASVLLGIGFAVLGAVCTVLAIHELFRCRTPYMAFRPWGLEFRKTLLGRRVELPYGEIDFWTRRRKLLGLRRTDGRLLRLPLSPLSRADRRRVLDLLEALPLRKESRRSLAWHLDLHQLLPTLLVAGFFVFLALSLGTTGMRALGTQLVTGFAPGAWDVRGASCRGVTIWTPEQREVLVEVGREAEGVVRWYVDDPEAPLVNCFVDSETAAPRCETVAAAYADSVRPEREFVVQVMTNGGDEFFCRGYASPDGAMLRGVAERLAAPLR